MSDQLIKGSDILTSSDQPSQFLKANGNTYFEDLSVIRPLKQLQAQLARIGSPHGYVAVSDTPEGEV